MPGNAFGLGALFVELELRSAEFNRRLGESQRHAEATFGNIQRQAQQLAMVSGIAFAGTAGAIGLVVKSAADFESAMKQVEAVALVSGEDLKTLGKLAQQLGAETYFSSTQAAAGIEALARGGVSIADIMAGAARATVTLAAAAKVDLSQAATFAADALSAFHMQGSEVGRVVDLIAGASTKSSTDMGELIMAFRQAAAMANLSGMSVDDLTTALGLLATSAIKGSDAGTSFRVFLQRLIPEGDKAIETMKSLGLMSEDNKNHFFNEAGELKSLTEIAGLLNTALGTMTTEQRNATMQILFGQDAIRAAAVIMKAGAKGIDDFSDSIKGISAAEMAKKQMEGLSGAIEELRGSVETLKSAFGTPFLGPMEAFVDGLNKITDAIAALPAPARTFIAIVSGSLAVAAGGTLIAAMLGLVAVNITSGLPLVAKGIQALVLAVKGFLGSEALLAVLSGPVGLAVLATGLGALVVAMSVKEMLTATQNVKALAASLTDLKDTTTDALRLQLVDLRHELADLPAAFVAGVPSDWHVAMRTAELEDEIKLLEDAIASIDLGEAMQTVKLPKLEALPFLHDSATALGTGIRVAIVAPLEHLAPQLGEVFDLDVSTFAAQYMIPRATVDLLAEVGQKVAVEFLDGIPVGFREPTAADRASDAIGAALVSILSDESVSEPLYVTSRALWEDTISAGLHQAAPELSRRGYDTITGIVKGTLATDPTRIRTLGQDVADLMRAVIESELPKSAVHTAFDTLLHIPLGPLEAQVGEIGGTFKNVENAVDAAAQAIRDFGAEPMAVDTSAVRLALENLRVLAIGEDRKSGILGEFGRTVHDGLISAFADSTGIRDAWNRSLGVVRGAWNTAMATLLVEGVTGLVTPLAAKLKDDLFKPMLDTIGDVVRRVFNAFISGVVEPLATRIGNVLRSGTPPTDLYNLPGGTPIADLYNLPGGTPIADSYNLPGGAPSSGGAPTGNENQQPDSFLERMIVTAGWAAAACAVGNVIGFIWEEANAPSRKERWLAEHTATSTAIYYTSISVEARRIIDNGRASLGGYIASAGPPIAGKNGNAYAFFLNDTMLVAKSKTDGGVYDLWVSARTGTDEVPSVPNGLVDARAGMMIALTVPSERTYVATDLALALIASGHLSVSEIGMPVAIDYAALAASTGVPTSRVAEFTGLMQSGMGPNQAAARIAATPVTAPTTTGSFPGMGPGTTAVLGPASELAAAITTFGQGVAFNLAEVTRDQAGGGVLSSEQQGGLSWALAGVAKWIKEAAANVTGGLGSMASIPVGGTTFGELFPSFIGGGGYTPSPSALIQVSVDKFFGSDSELRSLTNEIIRIARQEGLTLSPIIT